MQEGKVYRIKERISGHATVKDHGWLWVLVDLGSPNVSSLGVFRSVATGRNLVMNYRNVEEVSDAGG